jgi:lipopolysaccharide biosynthesis glycosyltransferase
MECHLPALFWSIARSHPATSPLIHFVCLGSDDDFPYRVTAAAERQGLACKTYSPKSVLEARLPWLRTYKGGCKGNPEAFYGRWLLADLLSTDIDHVVYLDTDVLVQSNVRQLIKLLPADEITGAVPDMPAASSPRNVHRNYYLPHLRAMGISPKRGKMFNSGVMVLSLSAWRKQAIADLLFRTRDEMVSRGLSLRFQDQDVLNVALSERIHAMPTEWNVTPLYLPAKFWACNDLELVHLIHFVTNPKPWDGHQWIQLPPSAAKVYLNARLRSETNAQEGQRWRAYHDWYDDLTERCSKPLTRSRLQVLKSRLDAS